MTPPLQLLPRPAGASLLAATSAHHAARQRHTQEHGYLSKGLVTYDSELHAHRPLLSLLLLLQLSPLLHRCCTAAAAAALLVLAPPLLLPCAPLLTAAAAASPHGAASRHVEHELPRHWC